MPIDPRIKKYNCNYIPMIYLRLIGVEIKTQPPESFVE